MKPYYETENGKLYHGDCLEVMRELESGSVDLILTDPPYDAKTHNGAILEHEINFKHIDDGDFLKELVSLCLEKSKGWCLCFCSLEMLAKYKELSKEAWIRAGIWDRIVNMPQISGDRPAQGGEGVAIFHRKGRKIWNGGGKAAIWRHSVERGLKEHPTQKPIKLFNELLQLFSNVDDLILDPFLGSGTTAMACERLGRKWIGIEISKEYCDIAVKRIEAERAQRKLF